MTLNARLNSVTDGIDARSAKARARYLMQMKAARLERPEACAFIVWESGACLRANGNVIRMRCQ